jgi:hypothetical protein
MGILEVFKKKNVQEKSWKRELEVPRAPPEFGELPEIPTIKDIPKVRVSEEPESSDLEGFEEEAVEEQEEVLREREHPSVKKPIFVSINSYRDMIDEISLVDNLIRENEDILVRISEFGEDSNKEFNKWDAALKDIQKKLIFVDRQLFEKIER